MASKRKETPKVEARDSSPRQAVVNLTWLSRAIEDGTPLERAVKEVYGMGIYGFAGDLRALLREVSK